MLPKRVRMFALFTLCFISWTSRGWCCRHWRV